MPNNRIPKQVTYPKKFGPLKTPLNRPRYRFDNGDHKVNQNQGAYPDVIALVDDDYIQKYKPRRNYRPFRRPMLRRRYRN